VLLPEPLATISDEFAALDRQIRLFQRRDFLIAFDVLFGHLLNLHEGHRGLLHSFAPLR
jgi:hypothetical protein